MIEPPVTWVEIAFYVVFGTYIGIGVVGIGLGLWLLWRERRK